MATVRQLLRAQVELRDVQFWIVEKDYALSYLLKAISLTDNLGEALVLKGGTALRKLYFREYRFSEDLDYSTREIGPIAELDAKFNRAVQRTGELLQEKGPFNVEYELMPLRDPHPGGQSCYIVRVRFPHHQSPMCRLKVEITVDEPIILEPDHRLIIHDFPEDLEGGVLVYQLQEVVAEKLRALLQTLGHLEERGWASGRVPRDYYDLWYLLKNQDFSGAALVDLVQEKASHRNVHANKATDFFHPKLLDLARRQWDKQLRVFVPNAPDVDVVLTESLDLVEDMWG
ncbi:MAG: nucleotidyl transferase AbiEii/AbiGii toxin family protein [Anaerolineales bacterium]